MKKDKAKRIKNKKIKQIKRKENVDNKLPDLVYKGNKEAYTKVSNEVLLNPNLSLKAKGLLTILVSNRSKSGWKTYEQTLLKQIKDQVTALRSGLCELEDNGYLVRIKYAKKGKVVGGQYIYTDLVGTLDIEGACAAIRASGYSPQKIKSNVRKPNIRKSTTNKNNSKEEKEERKDLFVSNAPHIDTNNKKEKLIVPNLFDKFWELYPRKKGVSKAKAVISWNKLCTKSSKERPNWKTIKKAIKSQNKSERWQKQPEYIPHPATWLNQNRWLDEAASLGVINGYDNDKPKKQDFQYHGGYKVTKKSTKM